MLNAATSSQQLIESNQLLGLFEHVHQSQVSCAIFADPKTLVTTGTDCTISAWRVTYASKSVELQPEGSLFGHLTPVTVLAVCRAFSTLLSASTDGVVLLWDLNRLEFVRELTRAKNAVQVSNAAFAYTLGMGKSHLRDANSAHSALLSTMSAATLCFVLARKSLYIP